MKKLIVLVISLMLASNILGGTVTRQEVKIRGEVTADANASVMTYENGTWVFHGSGSSGDMTYLTGFDGYMIQYIGGFLVPGAREVNTFTNDGDNNTIQLTVPPEWTALDGNLTTGYGGGTHMKAAGPNEIALAGGALASDVNWDCAYYKSGYLYTFKATSDTNEARATAFLALLACDINNSIVYVRSAADFNFGSTAQVIFGNGTTGFGNTHTKFYGNGVKFYGFLFSLQSCDLFDGFTIINNTGYYKNFCLSSGNTTNSTIATVRNCNFVNNKFNQVSAGNIALYAMMSNPYGICDYFNCTFLSNGTAIYLNDRGQHWSFTDCNIIALKDPTLASSAINAVLFGSSADSTNVGDILFRNCNILAVDYTGNADANAIAMEDGKSGVQGKPNTTITAYNSTIQAFAPGSLSNKLCDVNTRSDQVYLQRFNNCTGSLPNGDLRWSGANIQIVPFPKTPINITANTTAYWYQDGAIYDVNGDVNLTLPRADSNNWTIKARMIKNAGSIKPNNGDHLVRLTNTALAADACSVAGSYAVSLWKHYPTSGDVNIVREEANNGTWTP